MTISTATATIATITTGSEDFPFRFHSMVTNSPTTDSFTHSSTTSSTTNSLTTSSTTSPTNSPTTSSTTTTSSSTDNSTSTSTIPPSPTITPNCTIIAQPGCLNSTSVTTPQSVTNTFTGTPETPASTIPTIPTSIPTSTTNSTNSLQSKDDDHTPILSSPNSTLIYVMIPVILAIISIIIGIIIYKRSHKKQSEGTILAFEPMHPHVVVVDADGNSLGKRNSIISTSNNSSSTSSGRGKGNKSPSRMIKVLAYDNDEETESIVGNNNPNRKTMYYEENFL